MGKILLNDLVGLHDADLERSKVKFNQWNGVADPMEEYVRDPSTINNDWLLWHKKRRYFWEGQIAICFLQLLDGTWLLTTIKEITAHPVSSGMGSPGSRSHDKVFFGFELSEGWPLLCRVRF